MEIKLEIDSESEAYLPIGRINIGNHGMQIMFCPDGIVRAFISKDAIDDGSLIIGISEKYGSQLKTG